MSAALAAPPASGARPSASRNASFSVGTVSLSARSRRRLTHAQMERMTNEELCTLVVRQHPWSHEIESYLVARNINLVRSVANRFGGDEEMLQDGVVGLLTAIRRFDPSLGNKLSTVAVWWIRQGVGRNKANSGTLIRLPSHVYDEIPRVQRALEALGESASNEDLAAYLQEHARTPLKLRAVERVREAMALSPLSLDAPCGPEGDTPLSDFARAGVESDPLVRAMGGCENEYLAQLVERLPERFAKIIRLRYLEENTLESVGSQMGMSRERARQLEATALRLLRTLALEHPL